MSLLMLTEEEKIKIWEWFVISNGHVLGFGYSISRDEQELYMNYPYPGGSTPTLFTDPDKDKFKLRAHAAETYKDMLAMRYAELSKQVLAQMEAEYDSQKRAL